jgi:hypothetical protein
MTPLPGPTHATKKIAEICCADGSKDELGLVGKTSS